MINLVGGDGFVGSRLQAILSENSIDFSSYDKVRTDQNYIDVTIPDTMNGMNSAKVLINLAAEHRDDVSPKSLYDLVNVDGARNVCDLCRLKGINKIVFTSSVAIYGFAPEGTDESGDVNYFNDYGRTKYEAEKIYKAWQQEDAETRTLVIVRPTVIFGEGNRGNVYNLLKQIASGRFIMFGPGSNRKSMAYVENVAQFLKYATSFPSGIHIYNYIDKPDLDMNTLVSIVRETLFDRQGTGARLPGFLGILIGYVFDFLAVLTRRKLPVSSIRVKKFMSTTSFTSSVDKTDFVVPVPLDEGLRKTLRYEFIDDNSSKKTFLTE